MKGKKLSKAEKNTIEKANAELLEATRKLVSVYLQYTDSILGGVVLPANLRHHVMVRELGEAMFSRPQGPGQGFKKPRGKKRKMYFAAVRRWHEAMLQLVRVDIGLFIGLKDDCSGKGDDRGYSRYRVYRDEAEDLIESVLGGEDYVSGGSMRTGVEMVLERARDDAKALISLSRG